MVVGERWGGGQRERERGGSGDGGERERVVVGGREGQREQGW